MRTLTGMRILREASHAASVAFETHWVRHYLMNSHDLIKAARHPTVKRMRIAAQAGDIDTVMEELATHGRA